MTTIRSGSTPLGSPRRRLAASCRPYLGACGPQTPSKPRLYESSTLPHAGAAGSTMVQSGVGGVAVLVAVQLTCGQLELRLMEDVGVCDG